MAQTTITLNGSGGLSTRHYEATPQLTYNAGDAQLAGGIYNPFKKYGYLSPANNSITACTGTIANKIICSDYDSVNDDLYFGGGNILLRVDGLADLSVTTALTIDTDRDILDTEIYEIAGARVLAYVTDTSDIGDGMSIGFMGLDPESGIRIVDNTVIDGGYTSTYEKIGDSDANQKLAQRFFRDSTSYVYGSFDRVRVRLTKFGAGTTYTIKVGIQRGSNTAPDGTFIAFGTVAPSTLNEFATDKLKGEDVYIDLDVPVVLDTDDTFWLVVEPTTIGDMTGTNSFVWYRSDGGNSLDSAGEAYAYNGTSWAVADTSGANETFDYSLILSKTESWYPTAGDTTILSFTELDSTLVDATTVSQDFDTIKFDETHIITTWNGDADDGYVQVFSYSPTTGALVAMSTALEYDTVAGERARLALIDSTHFVQVWEGGTAVEAQVFSVNTSTYAITAVGSPTSIAATGTNPNVLKIDSERIAISYANSDNDGVIVLYDVNTDFSLTILGSALEYEDDSQNLVSSMSLLDSSHILVSWSGTGSNGYTRVISIDTVVGGLTIAQDATSDGGAFTLATSKTLAHTCGSEATLLTVGVCVLTPSDVVTGVTYAGVAMTRQKILIGGSGGSVFLYTLINPTIGANNIVVTLSGSYNVTCLGVSHTNVYVATTFVTADGGAVANQAADSVTITTASDNSGVVAFGFGDNGGIAAGANTTMIEEQATTDVCALFIPSTFPVATAGAVTINQTNTSGWAGIIAIAFEAGTSSTLSFAGAELEFDATTVNNIDTTIIDSTHFLLAYQGGTINELSVRSYSVDGSYTIAGIGTSLILDRNAESARVKILPLPDDVYGITYTGQDADGFIATVNMDSSYILTKSGNYQFDTTRGDEVSAVVIDSNVVIVVYELATQGNAKSLLLSTDLSDDFFYVEEGQNSFMRRADNGLLYWFTGRTVSSLDGSLTGGATGTFNRDILRFPSYVEIVDAVDARGFMCIAIHGNTTSTGSTDTRKFSTSPCGVYIWDRQSTVVSSRDYYTVEGAREIRKIFLSRNGEIMLITISNAGITELRKLANSKFIVVAKLELAGYPEYTDSITILDNMITWLGANGIVYAYGAVESGEPEVLHKIGSLAANATGTYASGVLVGTHTGTPVGTYTSWTDTSTQKLSKWYPSGDGTIDSVAQKGNIGNVYSSVKLLPQMSTVNHINLYNLPIATNDSTDMGDLKIYFNQSTTPWATKQVTKKDLYKGVYFIPVGKSYINSVQVEIEWDTTVTLGADMWNPLFVEINYTPTKTINRK